jgi:Flp pilus assembly protein TadG
MVTISSGTRAPRSDRGAAAIELALLLPVLLLMVGGITDLGRAFFTEVGLTNAARAGVKEAVTDTPDAGIVQALAASAAPGLAADGMTAAPSYCGGSGTEASVTTRVSFDWLLLGPVMSTVGGADALPTQLESTAVLRCN